MPDPDPPIDRDAAGLRAFLSDHDVECPWCGYNLRGSRELACPECGAKARLGLLGPPRLFRRALVPYLTMMSFVVLQGINIGEIVTWWQSGSGNFVIAATVFLGLQITPAVVGVLGLVQSFRSRAHPERTWWWAVLVFLAWGIAETMAMAVGWIGGNL